ncbi:hypothetical protein ERO13_A07G110100v2 [Gossypium hirsutum]|nr:hypothetical protein ERO13_A07G110100v2 [Gossypium hirsutum]
MVKNKLKFGKKQNTLSPFVSQLSVRVMNPSLCAVSPSIERKKVSPLLLLGLISATERVSGDTITGIPGGCQRCQMRVTKRRAWWTRVACGAGQGQRGMRRLHLGD